MKKRKKLFKITFSNGGKVLADSYEEREGGYYWTNGTVQGYSMKDMVKKIEEEA